MPDDPESIEKYIEVHKEVWPEVLEGQRAVGILQMQIYGTGRDFFMICDTIDDFDWVVDMTRLAEMPIQKEWESYVATFQGCTPNKPSTEKWQLMEKIFDSNK